MLAKQVIILCGKDAISLSTLQDGMYGCMMVQFALLATGNSSTSLTVAVQQIRDSPMLFMTYHNIDYKESGKMPLAFNLLMLMKMARWEARDPRDKVFGVVSLLDPATDHYDLVQPEYRKSATQVYIDCAKFLIFTREDLRGLCVTSHAPLLAPDEDLEVPSSVPNWKQRSTGMMNNVYKHTQICKDQSL
jgi:hypothetical protein